MIDCVREDLIVFKTLTGGYHCMAAGTIGEYMYEDHCEVNDITILKTPNGATGCSHRVGYSNIKKVLPAEYINNIDNIVNDFPELFI